MQEFSGTSLPPGWIAYSGQPGGDGYGYWDPSNLTVSGGELHFGTSWDAAKGLYSSAGVYTGQVGTYGEYLVRMKGDDEPGLAFTDVALLWPTANVWPPEIDFYEDAGGTRSGMAATLHAGPNGNNCCFIQNPLAVNATQWHTYGIIWTPNSITYTVDGSVWATVTASQLSPPAQWPNQPMVLDLQSENIGPAQPSGPIETMTVAWVAIYRPN